MRTIRLETILGSLTTPVLLGVLSLTVGVGGVGWVAGIATGWAATALLAAGRMRSGWPVILPPDWITLTRALLGAGVAALVANSFATPVPITTLLTLTAVALATQVGRRTREALCRSTTPAADLALG